MGSRWDLGRRHRRTDLSFALIALHTDASSVRHQRHVTRSDGFVILASHVISPSHRQHRRLHPPPPSTPAPGLQSSVDRHRETLLPQKQRSVYFVVTFFDSQDQSGERKKKRGGGGRGPQHKPPLFGQRQDGVCAGDFDVGVTVHPLSDPRIE